MFTFIIVGQRRQPLAPKMFLAHNSHWPHPAWNWNEELWKVYSAMFWSKLSLRYSSLLVKCIDSEPYVGFVA